MLEVGYGKDHNPQLRDIVDEDRKTLEHALRETLRDDQRLIVQVLTLTTPEVQSAAVDVGDAYQGLPEWCDVFSGLSEDDIAEVDQLASRRMNLTREPS